MAESEEALQLKRRARRRLVGALALVAFVVIILPLILDKEPGPGGPPLSVQIPSQDSGGFNTRVVPAAPTTPAAAATQKQADIPAVKAAAPAVEAVTAAATKEVVTPAKELPPPAKAETSPAQEPIKSPAQAAKRPDAVQANTAPSSQAWVVTLDAFSDPKNVRLLRTKLSAVGVKSYTEPVKTAKGELTRVRAGPFASKEAADKARAKLQAMGLKPGAVASQ